MTDAPLDPRALRDAFGCFMTGVTVVTTADTEGKAESAYRFARRSAGPFPTAARVRRRQRPEFFLPFFL